ncbi:MAG: hypothetical protein P4L50_01320 [Anaerolineaceae bacterium]|nr:hypothetical protein [Anaerolineaceae bacterium]
MATLSNECLRSYRAQTYRFAAGLRLASVEEAVEFVNQRGYVFFWPIKNVELPSLWVAAAGDRPVADEHDDPGHTTWGWKDAQLGKHSWYYGRILHRRNTLIALDVLPYFYALSPNYGEPELDYLDQYEQGLLTQEAKNLYEVLLKEGPLNTLDLRRISHMSSPSSNGRFSKALDDLQVEFKVLPVAISDAGSWHYAMVYDLVPRHFPNLIEQAGTITEKIARQKLAELFFLSVGAAREADLTRLFHWRSEETARTITLLKQTGFIMNGVELERQSGEWLALTSLVLEQKE